jgi:hypothetical protein
VITARYSGYPSLNGSTGGPLTFTIDPGPTVTILTSDAATISANGFAYLTATVTTHYPGLGRPNARPGSLSCRHCHV